MLLTGGVRQRAIDRVLRRRRPVGRGRHGQHALAVAVDVLDLRAGSRSASRSCRRAARSSLRRPRRRAAGAAARRGARAAGPPGASTGEFDITLTHCSALASEDAILHCRDAVSGDFHVDYSVLARVEGPGIWYRARRRSCVNGAASSRLGFSGANNVYFGLNPYYVRMQASEPVETAATIDAFHRRPWVADDQDFAGTESFSVARS